MIDVSKYTERTGQRPRGAGYYAFYLESHNAEHTFELDGRYSEIEREIKKMARRLNASKVVLL